MDAVFDAMRLSMQRGERIELRGLRRVPGEAAQARHRPQPADRQGSADPARAGPSGSSRARTSRTSAAEWRVLLSDEPPDSPGPQSSAARDRSTASSPRSRTVRRPATFQDRVWKHVAALLLTLCTTTFVGASHYASFVSRLRPAARDRSRWRSLLHGLLVQRPGARSSSARTRWGTTCCCRDTTSTRSLPLLHSAAAVPARPERSAR